MTTSLRLIRCGSIVSYGSGDRYTHTYCDFLPAGHEPPHVALPTAEEYTRGIVDAIEAQGFRIVPADSRP